METTFDSVVLTDWEADTENLGCSFESVVYELILLSLLYDKVLIPDGVFALSEKLASWAAPKEGIETLSKCFDLESIVVLKHPTEAYPPELREQSIKHPISTRATYIEKLGTKRDKEFLQNEQQTRLCQFVDWCLMNKSESQRFVGSEKYDIMTEFTHVLREVLSSKRHRKWRSTAFGNFNDKMLDDFIHCIDIPEYIENISKDGKQKFKVLIGTDGKPTFNRSLAFQLASLYDPKSAEAMQRLIQTCFAAPFCVREKAAGRYNRNLRELLWNIDDSKDQTTVHDVNNKAVSVHEYINIPLGLPAINTDFVALVNEVRESPSGKQLRLCVQNAGQDVQFGELKEAWRGVAEELAYSIIGKPKPLSITATLLQIGQDIAFGAVAEGVASTVQNTAFQVSSLLKNVLIPGAIGIASNHLYALARNDWDKQVLRDKIETAVEFRCTPIMVIPTIYSTTRK